MRASGRIDRLTHHENLLAPFKREAGRAQNRSGLFGREKTSWLCRESIHYGYPQPSHYIDPPYLKLKIW
jgi:hypothetical protein